MTLDELLPMTMTQRHAMLLGLVVRNSLECFHASDEYGLIPNSLMPELNTRIRNAIFSTSVSLEESSLPGAVESLNWDLTMIPSYWEPPRISVSRRMYLDRGNAVFGDADFNAFYEKDNEDERKQSEQWRKSALIDRERNLVEWYKLLYSQRFSSVEGRESHQFVTADEVVAKMKELGFPGSVNRGWDALAYWGTIYHIAGLRGWTEQHNASILTSPAT